MKTDTSKSNRIRKCRRNNLSSIQRRYNQILKNCSEYLSRKLTVNNCIEMILFGKKHRMQHLILSSAVFIDKNFEKVFVSDEFIEMTSCELFELLPLLIFDEMKKDDFINAVMFWSKYKPAERKKHTHVLLG